MKGLRLAVLSALLLLCPQITWAHVGSPDVFFEGKAGPYPTQITIRMPAVVPGRARIEVRPQTDQPVTVSVLPLYSKTAVKNAPPAETAQPVPGDPGLYSGDLWLMSMGAYSIEVRVAGAAGAGAVEIPVNSVATHQLPLPAYLRYLLVALGSLLTFGGIAIVYAAAGESVLAPGVAVQQTNRRKGAIAAVIATVVLTLGLAGGWHWWQADEQDFRRHLREGAWPDLTANVETTGGQRILHLTLGEKAFKPDYGLPLMPDHGKLLHLFLIREPAHDVFAHVHPVRRGGKNFDLALPEVPEGTYRIFCDLTLKDSGLSSTASGTVQIPAMAANIGSSADDKTLHSDPDDSWAATPPASASPKIGTETVFPLPGGGKAIWKAHPALHAQQNAHLDFIFQDSTGQPLPLEPYMGMMSHAAILRADGKVFAHLHPTGNYSMAAQSYFADKIAREESPNNGADAAPVMDHSKMHHTAPGGAPVSSISIPYEFPTPGDYIIWVQVKNNDRILTAAFQADVL